MKHSISEVEGSISYGIESCSRDIFVIAKFLEAFFPCTFGLCKITWEDTIHHTKNGEILDRKKSVLWNRNRNRRNRNFLTSGTGTGTGTVTCEKVGTGTGTVIKYGSGTGTRHKIIFDFLH
jgi:hypothetical protein